MLDILYAADGLDRFFITDGETLHCKERASLEKKTEELTDAISRESCDECEELVVPEVFVDPRSTAILLSRDGITNIRILLGTSGSV